MPDEKMKFLDMMKQQQMPHYLIVPTFLKGLILYGLLAFLFLIFGIVLLSLAYANKDYEIRYDNEWYINIYSNEGSDPGTKCEVEFELDEELKSPVFIYYKLEGFFGNHRNYVKSRSYNQMGGEVCVTNLYLQRLILYLYLYIDHR